MCWDDLLSIIGNFIYSNRDSITAVSTFVIVVFTVVLAIVTNRQAKLTAVAAQAALKSADISEKALLDLERPWLFLEGATIRSREHIEGPNNWFVSFTWKNVGRSPALIKKCSVKIEDKDSLPDKPNYNNKGQLSCQATVPTGVSFKTTEVGPGSLLVKDGEPITFVVYGKLTYQELNGRTHHTGYAVEVCPHFSAYVGYSNPAYTYYD